MTSQPDNAQAGPALAQMIHNSRLVTWLVRVIGHAFALLLIGPIAGAVLGATIGAPEFVGLGAFVSLVLVLIYLTSVSAPLPAPDVVRFAEDKA